MQIFCSCCFSGYFDRITKRTNSSKEEKNHSTSGLQRNSSPCFSRQNIMESCERREMFPSNQAGREGSLDPWVYITFKGHCYELFLPVKSLFYRLHSLQNITHAKDGCLKMSPMRGISVLNHHWIFNSLFSYVSFLYFRNYCLEYYN